MPYIDLPNYPGIVAILMSNFKRYQHLGNLLQNILRGPSGLSEAERELIFAYVSELNDCEFCAGVHKACAKIKFGENVLVVNTVFDIGWNAANLSDKIQHLLHIAGLVRNSGKYVTKEVCDSARAAGATDQDIHDTVIIASAACLCNRIVDGLGTICPDEAGMEEAGAFIAKHGYGLGILRFVKKFFPGTIQKMFGNK